MIFLHDLSPRLHLHCPHLHSPCLQFIYIMTFLTFTLLIFICIQCEFCSPSFCSLLRVVECHLGIATQHRARWRTKCPLVHSAARVIVCCSRLGCIGSHVDQGLQKDFGRHVYKWDRGWKWAWATFTRCCSRSACSRLSELWHIGIWRDYTLKSCIFKYFGPCDGVD